MTFSYSRHLYCETKCTEAFVSSYRESSILIHVLLGLDMRFRELVFPLWHHIMITQLLSTSLACILLSSLESLIEDTYLSEAFNHIWYVMQCRGPVASGSEVLLNLK